MKEPVERNLKVVPHYNLWEPGAKAEKHKAEDLLLEHMGRMEIAVNNAIPPFLITGRSKVH
eukprot:1523682-Amphidinium_carterae.1